MPSKSALHKAKSRLLGKVQDGAPQPRTRKGKFVSNAILNQSRLNSQNPSQSSSSSSAESARVNLALLEGLAHDPDTTYDEKMARAMALHARWKYEDTKEQALEGGALKARQQIRCREMGSSISELVKRPAYITTPWWQSPTINISCSKKNAIYLYNQYLAQKTALETLAHTDGSGINKKIGSTCIILGQRKAIKKFLGIDKTSIVYMGEMQGIQNSLIYTIS